MVRFNITGEPMRTFLITALLLAGAPAAMADDHTGFYFGAGGGQLDVENDEFAFDADTTAWKFFGGWQFNKYLALEGAFIDGGRLTQHYTDQTKVSFKTDLFQAAAVGTWWFNDYVNIFGRVGANHYEIEGRRTFNGVTTDTSDGDGTEFGYGAGVAAVWDSALFRLEYEQVDIDEADEARLVSLSIAWRF